MHKFVRNLVTEWRKLDLPFADKTFIVAVSGGADSVALALAFADLKKRKKLDLRFVIAHFNHDLRGAESELDAEFVKDFARNIEFELVYQKGNVSKKGNLEQNARLARYEFLTQTAEKLCAEGILTAHTINDQAETFLANLFRGSGLKGLSAMSPVTNIHKKSEIRNPKSEISLVRPLLNWAMREDTENFCGFCEIDFRNDSMNEDLNFTRVKIRRKLIPALKEFNPKIVETLSKTARLIQTELKETVENHDQTANSEDECLLLKDLKNLSKSNLYKVLRKWLAAKRGNLRRLELKHIEAIERLLVSRKSGKIVELPNGESVLKESGKLFWRKKTL